MTLWFQHLARDAKDAKFMLILSALAVLLVSGLGGTAFALGTQPIVAVHDSEYTRALENQNATGATPTGSGTTGKQWWPTDWHYFVMPETMKESLRSDGTTFAVIGDSNIIAGALLTNGLPKYPIVISLASEAILDAEIAQFTNYVAAGGFLFVGSSAFTRNTNGTSRGDFAFANELGVHLNQPGLTNWSQNSTYTKVVDHRINSHVPSGTLTWRLPSAADETPWGITTAPSKNAAQAQAPHDLWRVVNGDATVLAQGDVSPFLTVKAYGKGYFIYCAPMQPLLGYGGWAPSMYSYLTIRRSIEWAFETATLPVTKLSPWPFQYDAAIMVRHDLENLSNEVAAIRGSAQVEFNNGAKGDYYFCTGTLREDMSPTYNTNTVVSDMRFAMNNYGATITTHNGGLKNPNYAPIARTDYDYWHWGTDEALDSSPAGYPSGSNYAYVSLSASFQNIESWLSGLMTNTMRLWCAPYYNGTREGSLNIQSQLGVKIAGEQKVGPFPHWTLSTQIANKRFGILSQPLSDWFVGSAVSHSQEAGHTISTVRSEVDFYYNLGALINQYGHSLSSGIGPAGSIMADYVNYGFDTNRFPRLWSQNAIGMYQWWLQRSNVQVTASTATNGYQVNTTLAIRNSANTNTTVEFLTPASSLFCNLQILANGATASTNSYRIAGPLIKFRVGTTVTNLLLSYYPMGGALPVFSQNFDGVSAPGLPSGWTTSASGAASPWITRTSSPDTAPNTAFTTNASNIGTSDLVSPIIAVQAGQAQLSFQNNYDLEAGVGGVGYDGGVLEIKIGGGAFTDIITAGGSFVSGGYNCTIDSTLGSPLGGRSAWSGNSGGYVTTAVNLPALTSGQNVQFRWRMGSDNGNARTGWRVDSITLSNRVCLCCVGTNAPVLPAQADQSVNELATLTVTNTATDADVTDAAFYVLQNPPAGATIDGNGIITWTPAASFGGTTNLFTTIVTDSSGLSDTNSFSVTVINVNSAPILPAQTNRTIPEFSTLTVTNTASDPDLPPDALTYSLLVAPTNATISANGIITWTPNEVQGPGSYTFTTRVTDNGTPNLSATNSFTVTVTEVNTPPTLPVQTDRSIDELTTLVVTNTASDGDLPPNTLAYQLLNAPAGAAINSSGVISWTPNGLQGPSTNLFRTRVVDNGVPPLSATNSFFVVVNDTATCQFVSIFEEKFDGVTAPALPVGWTSSASGGQVPWVTTNTSPDSAPNAAFSPDPVVAGTNFLVSPAIFMPTGQLVLSFRNNYNIESNYDGGVLEIKIGNGAFTEILAAGGSFVSGGYNATIVPTDSGLTGQPAWSGNSAGYLSTVVNLPPAASGQTNQLRWRCVVDTQNSGSVTGWRVDTISISNLVCGVNTAPILPSQINRTIPELTTLTVTNTATDNDVPVDNLTYSLLIAPTNAVIDSNTGIITWTPTEAQGPSTNLFTTRVVDDGYPPLSATNSFVVTVTEVNVAPVFVGTPTNRSVAELTTLSVTNAATDADVPANVLTYALVNPPGGAVIDANGVITWTPSEAQGPSTNVLTTVVSDGTVSVTNSFVVTVTEVNVAPVFVGTPTNRTLAELTTLSVTNAATDADVPANVLTYALVNPPGGAVIDTNGVITWTPSEAQGPSTNVLTTVVSDGTVSVTNSFVVTVTEVNVAPVFVGTPTNRTLAELTTLSVTNAATDADVPANVLTYALVNPPGGAVIDANGVITWTPSEAQGPSTNVLTTVVSDGTVSVTNSFVVTVTEVNVAPVFVGTPTNRSVAELTTLSVTNAATDADVPANVLTYALVNPPGGAVIDANGVITWTPSEAQGPSTNVLTTVVSDGTVSVTNSFVVTVTEVNVAPVFVGTPTNRTLAELTTLTVTNAATDADVPANVLTYALVNPPSGAVIDANGVITWTPSEAQGPSTNVLTTVVSDGTVSVTNSFVVTVTEVNVAPVLPALTDITIPELTLLTVTNTAFDSDFPANVLGYQLITAPAGASVSAAGVISWTPTEVQGPSSNLFVMVVSDGLADATNSFVVFVTEVNVAPAFVGTPQDRTVTELSPLFVTNSAVDTDLPANILTYQLLNAPVGAVVDSNGVISWTPTEAQGPSTNTITTVVSDGSLAATNSFIVVVTESNSPPSLTVIADRMIHAGTKLSLLCEGRDAAGESNRLTFSFVGQPPVGAVLEASTGNLVWPTTDADANTTNSFTVRVTDDGVPALSAEQTFTVTVVARPEIQSIFVTNGVATISWSSIQGQNYRLQYASELKDSSWVESLSDLTASGASATTTNSIGVAPQLFYRIRVAP